MLFKLQTIFFSYSYLYYSKCRINYIYKYICFLIPTIFFILSEIIMKLPSFSTIVSVLFISYLANLFYSIWIMVQPPTCTNEGLCLKSFLLRKPNLEVCISYFLFYFICINYSIYFFLA